MRTYFFYSLLLGLIGGIAYFEREAFLVLTTHLYAKINPAVGEQLLGEYYREQSDIASEKAKKHYQRSLHHLILKYPKETSDRNKGMLAYLIASHYDCGKGADKNP